MSRWDTLAAEESTTPYVVHAALWSAFLSKLLDTDDVVMVSPVAVRYSSQELLRMLGTLQNFSVIRTDLTGTATIRDTVRRARVAVERALANDDLPVQLQLDDIPWDSPLGRVAFNRMGTADDRAPLDESADLRYKYIPYRPWARQLDLSWVTSGTNHVLLGAHDRFAARTIHSLAEQLAKFVTDVLADPDAPLSMKRVS
jgi:non-ribosomal peptide synthetase component F